MINNRKSYRSIIVDDEKLARDRLKKLLAKHSSEIEIIGEAEDGEEGLELIRTLEPELVFLDIQMPVRNGFEMLRELKEQPRIIFTTAYDQYAIRAFEENSVDYLLKPIEEGRLLKSIQKLQSQDFNDENEQLQNLLKKIRQSEPETISVSLADKIILVPIRDIVYFQAEDKYVIIHDKFGKTHLLSNSLKELSETFNESCIRIHRGTLINRNFIKEIQKGSNGKLTFVMKNLTDTRLSSSQSYTPLLRKELRL